MATPLREYLAQRRADIQAAIKALRVELAEIDTAERALGALGDSPPRRARGTAGSGKKTLKEMAIDVLQAHPEGLDAQGILAKIKERFEIEVARESMSPQLSRLGQDGVLARIGLIWKLAEHMTYEDLGKDETPHGYQPYGASEDEQPEGGSSDDDY